MSDYMIIIMGQTTDGGKFVPVIGVSAYTARWRSLGEGRSESLFRLCFFD